MGVQNAPNEIYHGLPQPKIIVSAMHIVGIHLFINFFLPQISIEQFLCLRYCTRGAEDATVSKKNKALFSHGPYNPLKHRHTNRDTHIHTSIKWRSDILCDILWHTMTSDILVQCARLQYAPMIPIDRYLH